MLRLRTRCIRYCDDAAAYSDVMQNTTRHAPIVSDPRSTGTWTKNGLNMAVCGTKPCPAMQKHGRM